MSRHVIIHWPDIATDQVSWAVADDDGRIDGDIRVGELVDAAEAVEGRRASLVIAGEGVFLSETHVPGGSAARAPTVVRYALEEQLADDVDDLHFALGTKGPGDIYPVAVIDRDVFASALERAAAAGLRPAEIVPETLALPRFDAEGGPPGWTALVEDEQAIVRLNGHKGFVADTSMAAIMLDGARAAAGDEEISLVLYDAGGAEALVVPDGIDVERRRCAHPLELYASGLARPAAINLLQGEYSPRRQFDRTWRPWRCTAGLAAGLLLIVLGGRALDARSLGAEEAALDVAIASAFEQALPGVPMRRPRRQIEQALGSLGAGGSGGFTARFEQLAEALATQSQTRLNSMSVRGGRFDLDLVTDAVPTLDALKTALESRGSLTMAVQSAVADGDGGIRARVRVE